MSLNKIFSSSERLHRARALSTIVNPTSTPTTIQPGVPVTFTDGPAVSLTASANGTKTVTTNLAGGVTSLTYENAPVGVATGEAVFAFDGTFEFAVTGAGTGTAKGVEVYIVPGTGALTLTASTNVHFGWTDYPEGYVKESGRAAVQVGA
jgi:hypothetical protein